ncbi:MAG: MotA/TolQ/ExbB proton channel family protein [bacterium]|nr:MotA/TolQ/ExbB proton channel family protein [bacterium]
MYLIGVLALLVLAIVVSIVSGVPFVALLDPQSLAVILIITIPVMLISGYGRDFVNAFRLTGGKSEADDLSKLKRASEAVALTMKTVLYSGIFGSLLGCIVLLKRMDDPATIGPHIMVAFVTLLYAIIINIMLLPVKAKLNGMIIDYLHE